MKVFSKEMERGKNKKRIHEFKLYAVIVETVWKFRKKKTEPTCNPADPTPWAYTQRKP